MMLRCGLSKEYKILLCSARFLATLGVWSNIRTATTHNTKEAPLGAPQVTGGDWCVPAVTGISDLRVMSPKS